MAIFDILSCIISAFHENKNGRSKIYRAIMSSLPTNISIANIESVFNINNIRMKVCWTLLKEICGKYDGVEDFINEKIEVICSQEKVSAEEVICFSVNVFLLAFFNINIVS